MTKKYKKTPKIMEFFNKIEVFLPKMYTLI